MVGRPVIHSACPSSISHPSSRPPVRPRGTYFCSPSSQAQETWWRGGWLSVLGRHLLGRHTCSQQDHTRLGVVSVRLCLWAGLLAQWGPWVLRQGIRRAEVRVPTARSPRHKADPGLGRWGQGQGHQPAAPGGPRAGWWRQLLLCREGGAMPLALKVRPGSCCGGLPTSPWQGSCSVFLLGLDLSSQVTRWRSPGQRGASRQAPSTAARARDAPSFLDRLPGDGPAPHLLVRLFRTRARAGAPHPSSRFWEPSLCVSRLSRQGCLSRAQAQSAAGCPPVLGAHRWSACS